jgi:ABC-type lipoprotein export system ATPase subunit
MAPSPYPRGSEWRRWDLHIHTPKSIVQQFGGDTEAVWNQFVAKLASLPPNIEVIAITDYLFCDGYEYLLTRRDEIPNIKLIIPNIEFRLNTFSGTANNTKRHNFHVLFDPSVSIQDIRDQLLNCLSTGYKIEDGTEWQQTPTSRSLSELGRQIKAAAPANNSIQNKSDLAAGFDNITYKRADIEDLLKKTCFKGKYVTAIGYSEWDQSRWDQSAAEKRDLILSANFSLTNLDDPAKIEANRNDLATNKLTSIILHSSDAHDFDRLGQTMLWIKADPTFAGLKQVLNEPEARVFIGTAPPNYKPDHKVISKISIPTSHGWFEKNFSLELNRDLVTIIGGRGSGKSALAEAIAYGAGSMDETEDAFLKKAAKHQESITGTQIQIEWGDGTPTQFEVGALDHDHGLVRYLPQGAVEELCSHRNSEKLQRQIENVIFHVLDETQRLGASDFGELKNRILSDFEHEKNQAVKKICENNKKLSELAKALNNLPQKEKVLADSKKELERLNTTLPELPPEDRQGQEELASLAQLKKRFEGQIVNLQTQLGKISEVESMVKVFKTQIQEFQNETTALLRSIGLFAEDAFKVHLNEAAIQTFLDSNKSRISGQLQTLKAGSQADVAPLLGIAPADLPFDNLMALNDGIDLKEKQTRAFETTKLKYQQQKKTALDLDRTIAALENEITKVKTLSAPEKQRLEDERMAAYSSYFDLLRDEKAKMEGLYKPLQDTLFAGTETDKKLLFEAKISYLIRYHSKNGVDIIDRTRRGNFREFDSLGKALAMLWDEFVRQDFNRLSLETELTKLIEQFTAFDGESILIEDQLRENYSLEDFYNWLYDPTVFEIVSSLTFDDTDLYLLSPGQKGIILLMLYLEIDTGDYRPLIIDQPEENLDNLSVYKDLINYFRDRKQYRQIIMVTHNPNLVVNTDAEQIIIANYAGRRIPRLMYCSGSLEDQAKDIPATPVEELEDGIIEQVCNILEGGEPAFGKRKRKYQISPKSTI